MAKAVLLAERVNLTCPFCGRLWSFLGSNPEGHTEVPCPKCLEQIHTKLNTRRTEIELGLKYGVLEAPPELAALHLGLTELAVRMVALEKGMPMGQLLGPARFQLQ